MWYNSVLWYDDNAITDIVKRVIDVIGFSDRRDCAIVTDASVLVDDRILDPGILTDADSWQSARFILPD